MKVLNKGEKIVLALVPLAVGGLFVAGGFKSVLLLNYLPDLVHTVVGYGLVAVGVIALYKSFK